MATSSRTGSRRLEGIFTDSLVLSLFFLAIGVFTSITISSLHHIFFIIALIAWAFLTLKSDQKIPFFPREARSYLSTKSMISLYAIVGFSWLSIISSWNLIENPIERFTKVKYFFLVPVMVLFYGRACDYFFEKHRQKSLHLLQWMLLLFLIATTLASFTGILALYTGFHPIRWKAACHPTRSCGMYGMYMTYAYGIQFFLLIMIGLLIDRTRIMKWFKGKHSQLLFHPWFLGGVFVINLAGFFLSAARGALLGFFLALPFFFLRKKERKKFFLIFALLAGLLFGIFLGSAKVRDLFFSQERIQSNDQRYSQVQAVFATFKERPLLGLGFKNFEDHSREIKERHQIPHAEFVGHAHNNFLEHLASTGLLGFLALIFFHLFWGLEMYRNAGPFGKITLPVVVALTVSGMFQYTLGDGENMFLLMGLYVCSQIAIKRESC